MKINKIENIIATRVLLLGENKEITVIIGKPEKLPDFDDYYCPYQIIGMGNEKIRYAVGIDSMQALLLTLNMIGTDLYTSKEAKSGILSWLDNNKNDLGFPLPSILSDLKKQ